jgi:hypothetical protein
MYQSLLEPDAPPYDEDEAMRSLEMDRLNHLESFRRDYPVPQYEQLAEIMAQAYLSYEADRNSWNNVSPLWPLGSIEAWTILRMLDEYVEYHSREDEPYED